MVKKPLKQPDDMNRENTGQAYRPVYYSASIVIGIALLALAGWLSGERVLAGQWGNWIPAAPLTALLFLLFGNGLLSFIHWPLQRISRTFSLAAGGIITLIALVEIAQFFTGFDLGIETALFSSNEFLNQIPLGRMSPMTAFFFLIEGTAFLILLFARTRRKALIVVVLFNLAMLISNLTVVVGYVFNAPLLHGSTTIPVAFLTAVEFILIGAMQIRLSLPGLPELQRWNRTTYRGRLLRAFLPFILVFTFLKSWIDEIMEKTLFSMPIYHSLALLVGGILFIVIVVWISERTGAAFEQAQAEIKNLSRFPNENINPVIRVGSDGKLLFFNPSSQRLINSWNCNKLGDILPAEQLRLINESFTQGVIMQEEVACREILYELIYIPIKEQGYLNVYGSDITEQRQVEKKLLENEERFRVLFEESPVPLWEQDFSRVKQRLDNLIAQGVTDMDAYLKANPNEVADLISMIKITDINMASVRCYKAKDKNDLKHNLAKILAPESYLDFKKELVAVSEGKSKFSWERRNLTLTGEPIDVRVIWSAVPGHENDLTKVFVSIEDITERKQIEIKLRESEESFRSLYENATIGIYRTTPDGIILMANQALVKMLGFGSFDELAGKNLNNEGFEPDPSRQEYQRRIEKEGEIRGQESAWRRKDGSTVYVRESARVVRDDKGKVIYYDGTVEDISQRHIAEKALLDSESELQALFASMKDLVIVYNKDGRYLKIAATDAQLLILPSKDLIGRTIHEVFPKTEADRWVNHIRNVLETQKADHIEYSLKIDNKELWFDASVSPINKDTVIWVAREITDRKQLEEKTRFIGVHDSLTQLYNRSYFEEELSRLEKSRLYPVSIFMIDVDGLKIINDSQGHAAGDHLLQRAAHVLMKSFRSEDMVARIGGDEFVVLLPSTDEEAAQSALNRIQHFLLLDNKDNPKTELIISVGLATGKKPGSLSGKLKEADGLMYQNKQARKLLAARKESKIQ